MTPTNWRALAHRHPGRVVYPEFNPDRPQPPWVPVKDNRTWWQRTQPRQAALRTVRSGWSSDPVPADPLSGAVVIVHPGSDVRVPHQPADLAYLLRLQNELPPPRRQERGWSI